MPLCHGQVFRYKRVGPAKPPPRWVVAQIGGEALSEQSMAKEIARPGVSGDHVAPDPARQTHAPFLGTSPTPDGNSGSGVPVRLSLCMLRVALGHELLLRASELLGRENALLMQGGQLSKLVG